MREGEDGGEVGRTGRKEVGERMYVCVCVIAGMWEANCKLKGSLVMSTV